LFAGIAQGVIIHLEEWVTICCPLKRIDRIHKGV